MRIQYENKFRDLLLFHIIHQFLSPVVQTVVLLVVIFNIFLDTVYLGRGFASAVLVGGILYFGLWTCQFCFNAVYLYSRKNKAVLTNHIVEIQDDAFYEETKYNRSYSYWNGIVKIVRRPGFAAVYVTPHMAHIIPKRAFESEQQLALFVDTCNEKLIAE